MRALIRSRRVALPLAALVLAGTGLAAYGAVADDATDYRTVAAEVGDVEQVLDLTGAVGSSGRSDLAFGTDGKVARVAVDQGDEVEKGDVIAVLDRAALRADVDQALSDVAAARAQLADDRDAQTSAVASAAESTDDASTGPTGPAAEPAGDESPAAPSNAALITELVAQQDAVLAAQSAASTALATAATALTTREQACAIVESPTDPTDGTTDEPTGDATDPSATSELADDCAAALAAVQSAQSATATAQTALQTALETLGRTLTGALGSVGSDNGADSADGADQSSDSDSGSGKTPAAPAADDTAASGAPEARTVTAATLAEDQASIDRAAADLAAARASLQAAVVRAPADGTVLSLAVAYGDQVASGDAVAVLVAPGLTTVSLEVTASQAAQLTVDTPVEVTPAGATEALSGVIGRIANVPSTDSSSDSGTTYPVEVALDDRDLALPDGIPASVAVTVGSAENVVTVPASAVVDGVVTVLEAGQPQRTPVRTGIVGSTEVEITDGLDAGAEVVLADLGADLPSGDSLDQGPSGVRFDDGGGFSGGGGPPGGVMMPAR